MTIRISRRTVLRGLGTAVALPWLEAMRPLSALAGEAAAKPPLRMAFIFVPNGINMADWTPKAEGGDYDLPCILEPLAPFKGDFNVLSGLALDAGRAHGDGPGDHARAGSTFLTGMHPRKTAGADIEVGVSVDQIAAQHLGDRTRFASLELGCERGAQAGSCDSGYSCAYSSNISWRTASTPVAKEIDPRLLFERLFSSGGKGEPAASRGKREGYRRSVLDFVLEDARLLQAKLGAKDQRKLGEYFAAIRELEKRLAHAQKGNQEVGGLSRPDGIPKQYDEHVRLMSDLLVLAFQGDLTRISSFMFANAGSNRSYSEINVADGHHSLSHHEGNEEKKKKIAEINRYHMQQLAHLLQKLRSVKEGDGTLLDNCLIVYGSGLGDGNRHNHDDLPILLLGKGGGAIKTGRHLRYPDETPLTNLYLTMLRRAGVNISSMADSTGELENLLA